MIHLDLELEEAVLLASALEKSIDDLNQEIATTERSEYRQMLKIRQELFKEILNQLRTGIAMPLAA